jgi:hypothetical protein
MQRLLALERRNKEKSKGRSDDISRIDGGRKERFQRTHVKYESLPANSRCSRVRSKANELGGYGFDHRSGERVHRSIGSS